MRRRRPGATRIWVTSAVLAVVVLGGGGVWWAMSVESRGREAQQHLVAARAALSDGAATVLDGQGPGTPPEGRTAAVAQLTNACAEAAQADALLRSVGGQMQAVMPLVDALGSVPGLGDRTRAQSAALQTGTQLAAAGSALCDGMAPLTALFLPSEQDATGGAGSARGTLQVILAARPKLVEAADRLDQTLQTVSTLSDADLDESARAGLVALRTRLPEVVQTLRDATALLSLLGAQSERRFLLVSQNPDELRPTGGYIGSAGVVAVSNGNVRLVEYGSSRAYDTPVDERAITPAPFSKYLGDYWQLAGANWWASFPDDARQLAYFYGLARPEQQLDGVVALDQFGLERLLEVIGPVDVPEYSERVGAADLQTALDRHVHAGDASDELGRKQFTAALSAAVLDRVLTAPGSQVPNLVRAVRTALDEQHLLISVWDPAASVVLAHRHWDGALLPAAKDSLLVADTEVTGSKQSQAIRRDVAYQVNLADTPRPRAQVMITYTNLSKPEPGVAYVADYRSLLRVYAPAGAVLTASQGFTGDVKAAQECGRAVFSGEVVIPQGATVQVGLAYQLPQDVVTDGGYDLVVQQQPGVPPGQLSVAVNGANVSTSVLRDNAPGYHYHWRLQDAPGANLLDAPLPEPGPGGCGTPPVTASPIAAPAWLEIPSAHISAAVVDLGLDAQGAMEAPPTPDVVGWYRMSARAGQPGNSVLSGHVDWGQNTAVFWGLRNLEPADAILVRGTDGAQHRYIVEWNRVFGRNDASASTLVSGSSGNLLTLITCDGVYDRSIRDYSDRRIVRAILSE